MGLVGRPFRQAEPPRRRCDPKDRAAAPDSRLDAGRRLGRRTLAGRVRRRLPVPGRSRQWRHDRHAGLLDGDFTE